MNTRAFQAKALRVKVIGQLNLPPISQRVPNQSQAPL